MQIYGFESDMETKVDQENLERLYGNIRRKLAAIGCADITQFEEDTPMASRRNDKEEKKIDTVEQRMNKIEEFMTGGDDRIKNIDMLVTTIRVQGDHIHELNKQLCQLDGDRQELMMREGLKNAFLAEKKLQEEFKEFGEKLMSKIKQKAEPPKQIENNAGPEEITPKDKGIIERKVVNDK